MISGLQTQLKEAAGDGHICIAAVVVHADHISAASGNDLMLQLQKQERFAVLLKVLSVYMYSR